MTLSTIPIIFDKSHLATLGGRLYSQSLDLVRELVANAWDADATQVRISFVDESLVVEDDGSGMDQAGLRQYFTIGSTLKKDYPLTPMYQRTRIGEFGIGKFAPLALCDRFELYTKKDDFCATVIFDKEDFEATEEWEVPMVLHQNKSGPNGTKVTLIDLKVPLNSLELRRHLQQQVSLREKNFSVFIDKLKLQPRYIPGQRFRLAEKTQFGSISGEIVMSALLLPKEERGVGIRVKGMLVKRDWFGLEEAHELAVSRLTGEVTADFLTLTSSRDNFITASDEYRLFKQVMEKKAKKISATLRKKRHLTKDRKESEALSQALINIRYALKKNADIFLLHDLPLFNRETEKVQAMNKAVSAGIAAVSLKSRPKSTQSFKSKVGKLPGGISRKLSPETRARVNTVLHDKTRLVKKIKIGGNHVVCSLTNLGAEEAESFSEGGIIFINRDHKLFAKAETDNTVLGWHLARLITQEIALLAKPVSAAQAYEWQSRLIRDALMK